VCSGARTRRDAARKRATPPLPPEDPVKRPSVHQIRLRDAGIDPQALLGHRDAETTQHYLDHAIQCSTRLSRAERWYCTKSFLG